MRHAICLLLWFILPLYAQPRSAGANQPAAATLPDSPSFTRFVQDANVNFADFRTSAEVAPASIIEEMAPKESHKVADREFVLFTMLEFSAAVVDIESTTHDLSSGYHEDNPLLGSRPSRAKLYGIGMPTAALVALCSYEFKKVSPHSKKWMIPPILAGSVHGGAAGHNIYLAHN